MFSVGLGELFFSRHSISVLRSSVFVVVVVVVVVWLGLFLRHPTQHAGS